LQYKFFANGFTPVLHIASIGYAFQKEDTYFGPGQQLAYIVHYVLSGKGYFNNHPVSAGQGFLTTPEDTFELHPDETDPWEYLWFVSHDPKMVDIFATYHMHPDTKIFDYESMEDARALAKQLVLHHGTTYPSLLLTEYFLHLFNNHMLHKKSAPQSETYADHFSSYVEAHIHTSIKIEKVTSYLGVSQQYLYKICKKHFGVSPKKYIQNRKLLYAKKLLQQTHLAVTDVGKAIGFDDVITFSKFFSSNVGISPSAYRKSHEKKIPSP